MIGDGFSLLFIAPWISGSNFEFIRYYTLNVFFMYRRNSCHVYYKMSSDLLFNTYNPVRINGLSSGCDRNVNKFYFSSSLQPQPLQRLIDTDMFFCVWIGWSVMKQVFEQVCDGIVETSCESCWTWGELA